MRHQVDACRESDTAVVDLLRGDAALEIGELADRLGVTATAVRQRLDRLMRSGLVEGRLSPGREADRRTPTG